MNCNELNGLLVEYANGGLAGLQKDLVELHINVCKKCRQELAILQQTRENLHPLATDQPSVHLEDIIMPQILANAEPSSGENATSPGPLQRIKQGLKSGVRLFGSVLNTRHPVWQTALACAAVVGIVMASFTFPINARQSTDQLARYITLASDILKEAMGNYPLSDVDPDISVGYTADGIVNVHVQSIVRTWSLMGSVDLKKEIVTAYNYSRNQATAEERALAIQILDTDSKTSSFMDMGAKMVLTDIRGSGSSSIDESGAVVLTRQKILSALMGTPHSNMRSVSLVDVDLANGIVQYFSGTDPAKPTDVNWDGLVQIKIDYPPLTEADVSKIRTILETDAEIHELLSGGAAIGTTVAYTRTSTSSSVSHLINIAIYNSGTIYVAVINRDTEEVAWFGQITDPGYYQYYLWKGVFP